jgi:hypothetical protein
MADPLIGIHSIHWVICGETYKAQPRAQQLEGGWKKIFEQEETVAYRLDKFVIIGFRGSHRGKDIIDDLTLANAANDTCAFPRVPPARQLTTELLEEDEEILIQCTGHSLGGAIARCVGEALNLGVVTFNAAAPPSNPVLNMENQVHYHIVFDIISAWQSPNTVRIDKGFRPIKSRSIIPFQWLKQVSREMYLAHSLESFSFIKKGKIISAQQENEMFQEWVKRLPFILRGFLEYYLGKFGKGKLLQIN